MMKQLLLDFLWSHLRSLGAFGRTREAAGVLPMYDAWFAEAVRVLETEGYLGRESYRPLDELWREWEAEKPRWRQNPDLADIHVLLETMLRAFPDILTGKRRATEVLFPGASVELVENAYKSNPESVFFNRVVAAELVARLRHLTEPRILEIGAGTGATTTIALDAIRSAGLAVREYRYTDLSRAFLEHAERSYGPGNPFLTYGILDIERPVAEQGIDLGGYDVVIAANVLHATRNIWATVRNTKAALKKGGLLLLNEATANMLINHFTFALLEGWWRFEDAEARIPGSPLLSVEGWRQVLTEEGFGRLTLPAAEATDLGQQIIMAESDGIVRQPAARTPVREVPEQVVSPEPDQLLAHVEGVVLDVLSEALRIDRSRIARHVSFADYGLDSIFAVQVARTVGAKLDLPLDVTLLFEYGTLAELGEFIVTEYGAEIKSAPPEKEAPAASVDGIAIVGISARFPQADDIDEFWGIVEQGKRCLGTPPLGREDWASCDEDTSAMWGGFLDGIHEFDPLFFGISKAEARQVPPELRLMLMTAWNAIEDAGYRPAELRRRPTGVFVAATPSEYRSDSPEALLPSPVMIPNRISYLFDLHGPSEQCDTRCSSSLVALHRAIRSIRDGECDQALVGGVNLLLSPAGFEVMSAAGMLSSSGDIRPFQQDGDGTARGEGVCAVLIKPLSRAVEDGDHIYGVVRGTAVAHGGKGVSFTAPNIRGMKSAITRAYEDAGIDPGSVSYVETHSMSTLLADSAEIAALRAGLRSDDDSVTYLGSLKPCIGHTEVTSGLAAVVKTVQAMRHGVIPAISGFDGLHRDISFEGTSFRIATESVPWPARTGPRRASINSFGIGGVNAHAVLEQHVDERPAENQSSPQVLVLSAKTEPALRERAGQLVAWLRNTDANWADVAYTLQAGREAMTSRLAMVAASREEAAALLDKWLNDGVHTSGGTELDRLADQWVTGELVDWSALHQGKRRRVSLPGYPFQRETCFVAQSSHRGATPIDVGKGPEEFVTGLVASVLGLEKHEIDSRKSLADYGLNSLLLVGMLSRLRGAFPAFQPDWLRVHDTLDEVVTRLSTVASGLAAGPRFPELLHLNSVTEGRPVFWIHGALASVESYRTIATRLDRPFYGIQARGFMTEHEPIEGIPQMAEYYLEIMRTVQPEGPYDVGGFCLGGMVSYEMTRLLQMRGQAVNSLIMIDSPDNTGWAKSNENGSASVQSAALQVVNSLLWPAGEKDLDTVRPQLIHQREVAGLPDDASFVRWLADLAAERGLSMGRTQIVNFIERNMKVQLAYRVGEYQIRPLAEPEAVKCTYFRNQRGLFLGELEPYFQIGGETFSLDHVSYWQDWERELPELRVVDIDAANHMTILHDSGPLAAIEQTCVDTYDV